MSEHYDVIVIGSGAGGGTLAYALAPTGKRILLLERGGWYPREVQNWDSRAVWGDLRYRNAGHWVDQHGKEFNPKQHYYVGGNTKVYGAVLFRLREQDFGPVTHVDGISPAWPLGYTDFAPWYAEAEKLYTVHGQRGVDPTEPPGAAPYPYPPVSHEPRIEQLADDLQRAGLAPFWLPLGIMINEAAPEQSACIRCATCDGFACHVRAKADAQVVCVEPALAHPNVTLRTNARVTRLETTTDGRAVSGVLVDHDGQRERYTADLVVVSCGAINSAALLLGSANDAHPHGLGNSSGLLGRNLMLHNNSSLIAISKTPNPTLFEKTLGINDYYYGEGEWDPPTTGSCCWSTARTSRPPPPSRTPPTLRRSSSTISSTSTCCSRATTGSRACCGPADRRRQRATPVRAKNSARDAGLSRSTPRSADVTVREPTACTPRRVMQVCSASSTTPTPRATSSSCSQLAICRRPPPAAMRAATGLTTGPRTGAMHRLGVDARARWVPAADFQQLEVVGSEGFHRPEPRVRASRGGAVSDRDAAPGR
jgi:glycine/D-amino acid oxidase-like deaminating enzyme